MGQELHYYPVIGLNGKQVYIFKCARADLGTGNQVEEIATKAKSTLRAGDYSPDIVIMVGEPSDHPKLFGSQSSQFSQHLERTSGPRRPLISTETRNGT